MKKKSEMSISEHSNTSMNMNLGNTSTFTSTPLTNSLRRPSNVTKSPNLNASSKTKSYSSNLLQSNYTIDNNLPSFSSHINNLPTVKHSSESVTEMKEFHEVFRDLDSFIAKELNDIQVRKRIGFSYPQSVTIMNEITENKDNEYEDQILVTLQQLKEEVSQIKENQKEFENKMRKHELNQIYLRKKNEYDMNGKSNGAVIKEQTSQSSKANSNAGKEKESKTEVQYSEVEITPRNSKIVETTPIKNNKFVEPPKIANMNVNGNGNHVSSTSSSSSLIAESGFSRQERIRKLNSEIHKEETLMMKINRVLESIKTIDDRNLPDIINIERHYLVASTRFQSALSEVRKLNEKVDISHLPPFHRKGRLYVRDIMLEVKSSYFQRPFGSKNEFLLAMMKYEDKVFATRPVRITDDVRIIRFTEKFSVPEIYMDFDLRIEIFGTTFWRKNSSVRETMLKKYGFVTFTLADTGNKPKRFALVEVLQSENVPIKSKVMIKITQKITTRIQYKGNLFIKLRDAWHESAAHLNGHLLEFTFKKTISGITRSQETMLLDLYNIDNDAVIPVDSNRISEKPFTFVLKFNHYVDVANF